MQINFPNRRLRTVKYSVRMLGPNTKVSIGFVVRVMLRELLNPSL